MLVTLLAWVYISLLCYGWGDATIKFISKIQKSNQNPIYGFSITCFFGLAIIASISQVLSIFMGLGGIVVQGIFLCPAIWFLWNHPSIHFREIRAFAQNTHPIILFLLVSMLLMILTMSVYSITHPDTLAYHAQAIKWAERYRAIPGLVHISYLYGLQNSWFLTCSVFSFSFTGTNALTFINTTVIAWMLIFITQKMNSAIRKKDENYTALLWFLLLVINLWTYTQIRLTVTSASPDFIATMYILLTAYLCIRCNSLFEETRLLVIFLCFFTLTIKLSALPVVLLAFYLSYPFTRKNIIFSCLVSFFVIVPFLVRNIIISGHLVFPAAFPDIINTDWKFDTNKLSYINKYILAFARTADNKTDPEKILHLPVGAWLQIWWLKLSLADKFIIVLQFFSAIFFAINYKKIVVANKTKKILLFMSVTGIIFWFLKAPDPRFGAGFLLLFPSLVFYSNPFIRKVEAVFTNSRLVVFLCLALGAVVVSYTGYRFVNYFKKSSLIYPEGIVIPYKSVYYDEINTCIPLFTPGNKNVTVINESVEKRPFDFRGNKPEQGFKAKKNRVKQ